MTAVLKLTIAITLFVVVISKKLHIKEDLNAKDKDANSFINLFNNEEIFTPNERFARHVQVVTESVLDHLISELKQQYFNANYNSNSPIRRLIRNLNKEMKRNEHNKMVKERQKKKANRTKTKLVKKNKKMTLKQHTTTTK